MFSDDFYTSPFKIPTGLRVDTPVASEVKLRLKNIQRVPQKLASPSVQDAKQPVSIKRFHPQSSLWQKSVSTPVASAHQWQAVTSSGTSEAHIVASSQKKGVFFKSPSAFKLPRSFRANVPHVHEVVSTLPTPSNLGNTAVSHLKPEDNTPFHLEKLPVLPWGAIQQSLQALAHDPRFQKKQLTGWGLQRDDIRVWMKKLFSPTLGLTDKMYLLTQIPMAQATRSLFSATLRQLEKDKVLDVTTTMGLLKKLSPETQGGTVSYQTMLNPPKALLKQLTLPEKQTLETLQAQPELLRAVAGIDGHPEALGVEDIWLASFSHAQLRFTPERVHQLQTLLIPVTAWHQTHATASFEKVLTTLSSLLPPPLAQKLMPTVDTSSMGGAFLKSWGQSQTSLIAQGVSHHVWQNLNLNTAKLAGLSPLERQWLLDLQKSEVLGWLSPLSLRPNELSVAALRAYWMLRHLSPDELPESLTVEATGAFAYEEGDGSRGVTRLGSLNPHHQRHKQGRNKPELSPEDEALMSDGLTPAHLLALVDIVERFGGRMMYAQLIAYRPQNDDEAAAIQQLLKNPLTHHALAQGDGNPEDITIKDLQMAFRKHLLMWMGPKRLRQLYQR
jgi:hypothetical protein